MLGASSSDEDDDDNLINDNDDASEVRFFMKINLMPVAG